MSDEGAASSPASARPTSPRSKARISPLDETARTIRRLMGATPYFVATRELELKVHSLEVAREMQKREQILSGLRDAFFARMNERHGRALKWAVRIVGGVMPSVGL